MPWHAFQSWQAWTTVAMIFALGIDDDTSAEPNINRWAFEIRNVQASCTVNGNRTSPSI